jgi:hypothetical protein
MPDYAKTIIYKLVNYDYPELVYVGSTTNFTKRKQHHKNRCLNEKYKKHNLKVYVNIREYDGWDNWNMIKICDYPCENRREAELKEDEYMTELKANMNMIRASRTQKQYREDNREKIQQYREDNREKMKEYRDNNKEKIQEYGKEYYETNKNTILENNREKITCKCGSVIIRNSIKRHERTKKHINLMNPIQ